MRYFATQDTVSVAAGTIDEDNLTGQLIGPSQHIFVEEKAFWLTLPNDGLPRYKGFGPDYQALIDGRRNNPRGEGER